MKNSIKFSHHIIKPRIEIDGFVYNHFDKVAALAHSLDNWAHSKFAFLPVVVAAGTVSEREEPVIPLVSKDRLESFVRAKVEWILSGLRVQDGKCPDVTRRVMSMRISNIFCSWSPCSTDEIE